MKRIDTSDEQAWLQARLNDITSTEVSALFGVNPYMTKYELWHRKKDQEVVTIAKNERMRWGLRLEDAIAKGIAEDQGLQIRRINQYWSDEEKRIGSSFDFGVTSDTDGPGLLEVKNVDAWAAKEGWVIINDEMVEAPVHIEFQMQHQLLVSGRGYGFIGALVGGNRVILLRRTPNKKAQEEILNRVRVFWRTIGHNAEPDPIFPADAEMVAEVCSKIEEGKAVAGDPAVDEIAHEYLDAAAEIKELDQIKKTAKAKLLLAIGDAVKVVGHDYSISAGEIKESVVERHTRPAYRGFRVTPKKGRKPKE